MTLVGSWRGDQVLKVYIGGRGQISLVMQSTNVSVTWENTGSDTKGRELAIKGPEAVQDDISS